MTIPRKRETSAERLEKAPPLGAYWAMPSSGDHYHGITLADMVRRAFRESISVIRLGGRGSPVAVHRERLTVAVHSSRFTGISVTSSAPPSMRTLIIVHAG